MVGNHDMHHGKAIMLFRKFKNKSQTEVGKRLNKTQQYISHLEGLERLNGKKLDTFLEALNSNRDEWEKFKRLLPLIE